MPTRKMILTQNLVFNVPMVLVMTLTAAFASGAGLNPGTVIQCLIGLGQSSTAKDRNVAATRWQEY